MLVFLARAEAALECRACLLFTCSQGGSLSLKSGVDLSASGVAKMCTVSQSENRNADVGQGVGVAPGLPVCHEEELSNQQNKMVPPLEEPFPLEGTKRCHPGWPGLGRAEASWLKE